ncbi:TPA: hypothetical protein U1405_001709 [Streptococcus suis]|uniref:hypothetical protein n=1 Tax=Streptococcus suis TaxID=1307 RepID=UPI00022F94D1|nr:hypothetical protein [Streptococcus suis]AER22354.1 membrane protein [Streptococcus suis ST1]MDW8594114.1 hypothetical protein [Streptococcus suis]MDW8623719.1 hypothetical protein [Streptococcus suis]NQK01245.1 hypothetical protein [Streptococcus suis]NQK04959.1 hypothetical protein [Streptococcus suis]
MRNYLQQWAYASLAWFITFFINSATELFQLYNATKITLMGLQIQNIDTSETLTNYFSLTPRFHLVYFGFSFAWLAIYSLGKKYVVNP